MARYQGTDDELDRDENAMSDGAWWAARATRMDAEIAAERAHVQTPQGRLEQLRRRASSLDAMVLEGMADTSERDAAWAAVHALSAEIAARAEARFAAEWTPEITAARRAAWNARVRSGEFNGRDGKADVRKVNDAIVAQGWTLESLKRAVALHGQ